MSSSPAAAWAWAPSWNGTGRHVPAITPASWPEVVSELLTHVSVQTTAGTYAHLDADDLADELARAGFRAVR
jgi:integrase